MPLASGWKRFSTGNPEYQRLPPIRRPLNFCCPAMFQISKLLHHPESLSKTRVFGRTARPSYAPMVLRELSRNQNYAAGGGWRRVLATASVTACVVAVLWTNDPMKAPSVSLAKSKNPPLGV